MQLANTSMYLRWVCENGNLCSQAQAGTAHQRRCRGQQAVRSQTDNNSVASPTVCCPPLYKSNSRPPGPHIPLVFPKCLCPVVNICELYKGLPAMSAAIVGNQQNPVMFDLQP